MNPAKTFLYTLTFMGLYLELGGAFLLSLEAIGRERLAKTAEWWEKQRVVTFIVLVILTITLVLLARMHIGLHLPEALVLVISMGLLNDFAPRLMKILLKNQRQSGLPGLIGFALFAIGFFFQAYVTLTLLY